MKRFAIAAIAGLVCVAACTSANEPAVKTSAAPSTSSLVANTMIDDLPPPLFATAADASKDRQQNERLSAWLNDYLKNEYRINASRFFTAKRKGFQWVAVWKGFANHIEAPLQACIERQSWHSPGYDLIAVWRIPSQPYKRIAIATLNDETASSGDRRIGYFELERIETSRGDSALAEEQRPCGQADES